MQTNGRLKLTDKELQFKPSDKSRKGENVTKEHIEMVNWQRLAGTWGIRIFTSDGKLHRFAGFKEAVSIHSTIYYDLQPLVYTFLRLHLGAISW